MKQRRSAEPAGDHGAVSELAAQDALHRRGVERRRRSGGRFHTHVPELAKPDRPPEFLTPGLHEIVFDLVEQALLLGLVLFGKGLPELLK